jgi:hypothetical protein
MPAKTTRSNPRPIPSRKSRVAGKITKPLVTPRMVEQRARELALIAGRTSKQITATDRREAKRELLGPIHPTARTKDAPLPVTAPWGSPAVSAGRRTKRTPPADDEQLGKQLVEEGVDEAEHDQMLAARKAGK